MKAHLAMLPRLQAREQQDAMVAANFRHFEEQDRKRLMAQWEERARGPAGGGQAASKRPLTADMLAAAGIGVHVVTK